MYKHLDKIKSPSDFKEFSIEELVELASECREFLIDRMSKTSGHFSSSLGVVELTVALHYIYNTPEDLIVWDVGHQAYIHKLLTGRKDLFHTLRQYNGMSGFPKISESEYDTFGVGHASTSISAAFGMACANYHLGNKDKRVVAVIGDGSMSGGLAFEGLNNAGDDIKDFTIILNDNDMSIDDAVGALNRFLTDFRTSKSYNRLKDDVWDWANRHGGLGNKLKKLGHIIEEGVVSTVTPGAIFEQFGFDYIGPVDGHDLPRLLKILKKAKEFHGPVLIHLITKKGKGYEFAEADALKYHAIAAKFDPHKGYEKPKSKVLSYTQIFGDALEELMEKDNEIIAVTPAMISGSGLKKIEKKFPERLYDVGIAEGHSVTFSAGLATQKVKPVTAIYSSFLQRAYDNLIHDVTLQNLHVVFAIDRAGVVGADGPTHHGCFDISYLRCVPNIIISAPGTAEDLRNLLYTALYHNEKAFTIRYPRDGENIHNKLEGFKQLEIGKGKKVKDGEEVAILAFGTVLKNSLEVAKTLQTENIKPAVYNMLFAKPIDETLITELSKTFKYIVTIEEGSVPGGFGSAVLEFMNDQNLLNDCKLLRIGIPDRFVEHGNRDELFKDMGLDHDSLMERIKHFIFENQEVLS
jgi:1-deoxy-D-xylulose-5-phosphate synthase